MSDLMLDVGQAHELKMAFRRADYSNGDIKRLCEGTILKDVREILLDRAFITTKEHIIDCDVAPYVPDGWEVVEHHKGGQFRWDASRVVLYLSDAQKNGGIGGITLREEFAGLAVLNANVLDDLLKNPRLIPKEWSGKWVCFWGTVYRNARKQLSIRCLEYSGIGCTRELALRLNGKFYDYHAVLGIN